MLERVKKLLPDKEYPLWGVKERKSVRESLSKTVLILRWNDLEASLLSGNGSIVADDVVAGTVELTRSDFLMQRCVRQYAVPSDSLLSNNLLKL